MSSSEDSADFPDWETAASGQTQDCFAPRRQAAEAEVGTRLLQDGPAHADSEEDPIPGTTEHTEGTERTEDGEQRTEDGYEPQATDHEPRS